MTDGRNVQFYHKSEIVAEISELNKFEIDGTPKKRANYDRQLADAIQKRMRLINQVYESAVADGVALDPMEFQRRVESALNPKKRDENKNIFIKRFEDFILKSSFSDSRKAAYRVTLGILKRFLSIYGMTNISISDVSPDFIMTLRDFMINEYKFAEKAKYKALYANVRVNNMPAEPRAQNTVATKLKQIQAFFSVLEDSDEITKSPFRKLGREKRRISLSERYASPTALTLEELRLILSTDVPDTLKATKDAFLVQCALGCRISDFKMMKMGNVAITADGVPYVRYVAQKTRHTLKTIQETKTPLIRFAFDIIKSNGFNMPILSNVSGKDGFNKKIKDLLRYCGIEREVDVLDEQSGGIAHRPMWETASTKLGRKTNVTLLSRVQINSTIGGLHTEGSEAVKHYLDQTITDLFLLMCRAFGETPFRVNQDLEII